MFRRVTLHPRVNLRVGEAAFYTGAVFKLERLLLALRERPAPSRGANLPLLLRDHAGAFAATFDVHALAGSEIRVDRLCH